MATQCIIVMKNNNERKVWMAAGRRNSTFHTCTWTIGSLQSLLHFSHVHRQYLKARSIRLTKFAQY